MKYHTSFFSKIRKDVAKFLVCCSRDWRFKGKLFMLNSVQCGVALGLGLLYNASALRCMTFCE